jgi:hypothetical protein
MAAFSHLASPKPMTKEKVQILNALGLHQWELRKEGGKGARTNKLFTMMFFLVLACEVNVYGFVLAAYYFFSIGDGAWYAPTSTAVCLMRAALVLGLLSYCAAVTKCLAKQFHENKVRAKNEAEREGQFADKKKEHSDQEEVACCTCACMREPPRRKHCSAHLDDGLRPVHCLHHTSDWLQPAQMHYYHFLPACRWIVALKSLFKKKVHDDAEVLFKAYALSTFTLGFVQVVCFLIGLSENLLLLEDTAVLIVLPSLILNLVITMSIYFTPFAGMMKDAARIEELKLLHGERSRHDLILLRSGSDAQRAAILTQVYIDIKDLAQVVRDFVPEACHDGRPVTYGCPTVSIDCCPGENAMGSQDDLSEINLDVFSVDEVCLVRTCLDIKHFKWCCGCCATV